MLKSLFVLTVLLAVEIPCKFTTMDPFLKKYLLDKQRLGSSAHKQSTQYDRMDPKYFDSVVEHVSSHSMPKGYDAGIPTTSAYEHLEPKVVDKSYEDIKSLLARVLERIEEIERIDRTKVPNHNYYTGITDGIEIREAAGETKEACGKTKAPKKENEPKSEPKASKSIKWGHWTDWSSCSVSCGKGRQIRWRHCVENCQEAETEMEEKTCQLPACSPGKLFGVIKI